MMRKFTALLAAFAFAATTLAPLGADARDRRGDGRGYYGHDYDRYRHRHRDRDDGDAVAAGLVGLVLGLAIGSIASQPREPRVVCRDNYRRCPPPDRYDRDRRYEEGYYDPRYDDRRYDDRRGSAYEDEYGLEGGPYAEGSYDPYYEAPRQPRCMRRERQWDRYARRYVLVDVPC
jgi:hypothetical protein